MINPSTWPLWLKILIEIFAVIMAFFIYTPSNFLIRTIQKLNKGQKMFCAVFIFSLLVIFLGAVMFAR